MEFRGPTAHPNRGYAIPDMRRSGEPLRQGITIPFDDLLISAASRASPAPAT
jgi:hypothetical protein